MTFDEMSRGGGRAPSPTPRKSAAGASRGVAPMVDAIRATEASANRPLAANGAPLEVIDYLRERMKPPPPMRDAVLRSRWGAMAPLGKLLAKDEMVKRGLQTPYGDVRLEYEPRPFAGAKGLVEVMKPPGYGGFDPEVEYGMKFDDMTLEDGDIKGVATEYWRGGPNGLRSNATNTGHGEHDNVLKEGERISVGASAADREAFRQLLEEGQDPLISAVRTKGGVTSFLTAQKNLERMPKYILGADGPLELSGEEHQARREWPMPVVELFFDDEGGQLNRAQAEALIAAAKERYARERKANARR